jgi:hypothetical protein
VTAKLHPLTTELLRCLTPDEIQPHCEQLAKLLYDALNCPSALSAAYQLYILLEPSDDYEVAPQSCDNYEDWLKTCISVAMADADIPRHHQESIITLLVAIDKLLTPNSGAPYEEEAV